MLSILIPEYNYNCIDLVKNLHSQCELIKITFEIIVFDDNSLKYKEQNKGINSLTNCKFIESKKNIGRAEARNKLSNIAQYKYNLFLDSDTMVDNKNFISNYIKNIDKADIIIGGYKYLNTPPNKTAILRWKYGLRREQVSSKKRNKNPYKSFTSFNFLIKKDIFNIIKFENNIINTPSYGHEDTLFGIECKKHNISIYNIENPLVHKNTISNKDYLRNSLLACEKILSDKKFQEKEVYNEIKIFKIFMIIKKTHLSFLLSFFYKISKKPMEKNLFSNNPKMYIFDLYRLSYICNKDYK